MQYHGNEGGLGGDTPALNDYDRGWIGVDMTSSPDRVAVDKVSFARNKRFRNGDAAPRKGIKEMEWASISGFERVYDAITFSSVDDYEWILRATADGVYISRPEATAKIALPEGVTLDDEVAMVQAFNKVFMFRGETEDPLVWTPSNDPANPAANAFGAVPSSTVDGNLSISRSLLALWRHNRLWVAHDRDTLAASDIGEPHEFDPNNDFNIEKGAQDSLVGLYPLGKDLLVFKSESIMLLGNITGDLDATSNEELTRELGLKAARAVTAQGPDVWFLSDSGVQSISQVLDNKLQGKAAAVSRDVQPLIDMINWQAGKGICSTFWDGKYYLALPVDGSETNNIVLVYDTQLEAWQGFDQSERHDVFRWCKMQYQGRLRLFFVDTRGRVFLYEEDYEDRWDGEGRPIKDALMTRGYLCGTDEQKVFHAAHLSVATQDPEMKVSTVVNGFY